MAGPDSSFGGDRSPLEPGTSDVLPIVPGPRAGRILGFLFVVLAEYWIAPLFLGITNYAGVWSEIGMGLFAAFVAGLVVLVLVPLGPHLAAATQRPRDRWTFHGLWTGALVASLFVTNSFQLGVPASAPGYSPGVGISTVYTPFGAWPSLTVYAPTFHFYGVLVPDQLLTVALLSILGSALFRLGAHHKADHCVVGPRPHTSRGRLSRFATLALWSPLGLITGCASCAPAYLALASVAFPAATVGGLSTGPLVPWIGFTGLLYLGSFTLALFLLRRATTTPIEGDLSGASE